jgi:hypothetical protein
MAGTQCAWLQQRQTALLSAYRNDLRDGSRGLKLFRVRSRTNVDHNGEVAAVAPVDWHNLHCKRQPMFSALEIAAVEHPKLLG